MMKSQGEETATSAQILFRQVLEAIAEGSRQIVVWGVSSAGIHLLSYLATPDFDSLISGVIDQRRSMQGRTVCGHEVLPPAAVTSLALDTLVITLDEQKEQALEEFSRLDQRTPRVVLAGTKNYDFNDPDFYQILKSCMVKPKSGGYTHILIHLYQSLQYVAERGIDGDIAEFGVFQGGATVFIAKALQHFGSSKKIYGFDTFSGFPPRRSVLDTYKDAKCEYSDYAAVKRYCSAYNIELVRGDILETKPRLEGITLALSFFDTDNYSPTKAALQLALRQTTPGGILAFDHYYSPDWLGTIGERIAVKEVLLGTPVFHLHGTGIFIKL